MRRQETKTVYVFYVALKTQVFDACGGKLLARKLCTTTKTDCYNLGQRVRDKFTKLSKISFSMECFTADFLQLLPKNVKIWL